MFFVSVIEFGLLLEIEGVQVVDYLIECGLYMVYVIIFVDDFVQCVVDVFKVELFVCGGQVVMQCSLFISGVNFGDIIVGMSIVVDNLDVVVFISMWLEQVCLLLLQLCIWWIILLVFVILYIYVGSDDVGDDCDLEGVEFCDVLWLFDVQLGLLLYVGMVVLLFVVIGSVVCLFVFGMDVWNFVLYLEWLCDYFGSYLFGVIG